MCEPLPGPRCSSHASNRLAAARAAKDAAEAQKDAAGQALRDLEIRLVGGRGVYARGAILRDAS